MARVIDETFEANPGYDEAWTETIIGTGTIDEDFPTASVTGAPANWDSQCCRIITEGDFNTFTHRTLGSNQNIAYLRVEIVVISITGLTGNDESGFTRFQASGGTPRATIAIRKSGTGDTFFFRCDLRYDGSTHNFDSAIVNLNQRYRHEIRWDITNDVAEWRIDGVTQTSQTITVENPVGALELGSRSAATTSGRSAEYALDNIAWDDTDWVGAEAGGDGGSFPPLLRSFDPAYLRI